jgi:hypothetical protein
MTVVIESIFNAFFLKRNERLDKILYGTIICNLITYLVFALLVQFYIGFKIDPEIQKTQTINKTNCTNMDCTIDSLYPYSIGIKTDISSIDSINVETYKKGSNFSYLIKKGDIRIKKEFDGNSWRFFVKNNLNLNYDYKFSIKVSQNIKHVYYLSEISKKPKFLGNRCLCILDRYKVNGAIIYNPDLYLDCPYFEPTFTLSPSLKFSARKKK